DQEIGSGFSDVVLLGGGRFAGKYKLFGNDDYAIFDAVTGQPVSAARFHFVQQLGDGYFAVPTQTAGIGMMDVVGPNGNTVVKGAFPANSILQYMGNGTVKYTGNGNPQYVNLPNFTSGAVQAPVPSPAVA